MSGGVEALADDSGDDLCLCPGADRRHRCQDGVKRVGLHDGLDTVQDLGAGSAQLGRLRAQARQDDAGSTGAGDHHGLFGQGGGGF